MVFIVFGFFFLFFFSTFFDHRLYDFIGLQQAAIVFFNFSVINNRRWFGGREKIDKINFHGHGTAVKPHIRGRR